MRTRRSIILIAALAVLTVAAPAAVKVIQSLWAPEPLAIDGKADEWAPDTLTLEKSVAVSYAFKNDDKNLYLFFHFNDAKKYMSSIEQSGFSLWVNPEGKERKVYGLKFYRKTVNGDELIKVLEQQGQVLDDAKKQEIKAKPQYVLFACDAMNKKGEFIPHPAGAHTSTYRSARAGNTASYEFVIPFELLADPTTNAKIDPNKPLTLGFEWGGATPEQLQAAAAALGDRGASASAGGGGDVGSFVGGGEGGGGFNAPGASLSSMRRQIPKKYDFWATIHLAQKQ
jgi:hypothetical protein